ncbi:alpha/beta hydrolase fold domain-containing protein, partial [Bacillus cereus]|uniref:alpha/beta hydrolase fold domain-containing protein n=1 Tax=Bacillus cereus TaxID=1396 RepID=UPI0036734D2D
MDSTTLPWHVSSHSTGNGACIEVARWIEQEGAAKDLDGTRLAVAGDSVGGNMTAALTLMAKERGGPALAQQVLF